MFGFGDPNIYQPRAPANPRLLKALATVAAANTDAVARHGFFEALMNSVLLVPTGRPDETLAARRGSLAATGNAKNLLLVEDERGQPAVCVFTDLPAMHRWQPGTDIGFLSLPTPQLLRESFPTTASGMWINIADRAARFVSRLELAQITSGLVCPTYTTQMEKELAPLHADFAPRLPTSLPSETVTRVVEALKREAEVVQAYLMTVDPNPKRARLCVGLRLGRLLDDAAIEALLCRVARTINDARLNRRNAIDVIVLDFKRHRAVAASMPAIFER